MSQVNHDREGRVVSVSRDGGHAFSKPLVESIRLLVGQGVEGDAHCGVTVQHRSRVAANPAQPNLRQVHLIHAELFAEVASQGFRVMPGQLGENIATLGLDLLALPTAARLHIGHEAIVELTGLRNPCAQIDRFQKGLLAAVLERDADGGIVRKAGVMGIVIAGGPVKMGDSIRVVLPDGAHRKLVMV
jgi:MOSC domain-containing protein YiiM